MAERRIGIRELKSKLSECVREVRHGGTIVVTEHGRPVARMFADATSLEERLEVLANAGRILWSGRRLKPTTPVARVRTIRKTVADLIDENRE
jgi:antitoxin (DNA-binding transcriptional repressor) of toxin-antitoxin stability system